MTDHEDLRDRLHALGSQPVDPARQAADLTAMAALRPPSRLLPKLRVAAALLAGLLIGGTGLAAANALPDQAQHVAHKALRSVGVDVPNPARYHGGECGAVEMKNHGAYVSSATDKTDKKAAAESDCGKPVQAVDPGTSGADDAETDADAESPSDAPRPPKGPKSATQSTDPCQGPPPWAHDRDLSEQAKAQAQADRDTTCVDEADPEDTDAPEGSSS